MFKHIVVSSLFLFVLALPTIASEIVIDFESPNYTTGDLALQDSWVYRTSNGTAKVVNTENGIYQGGSQCIELDNSWILNPSNGEIWLKRPLGVDAAATDKLVTLQYDIRVSTNKDAGDGWVWPAQGGLRLYDIAQGIPTNSNSHYDGSGGPAFSCYGWRYSQNANGWEADGSPAWLDLNWHTVSWTFDYKAQRVIKVSFDGVNYFKSDMGFRRNPAIAAMADEVQLFLFNSGTPGSKWYIDNLRILSEPAPPVFKLESTNPSSGVVIAVTDTSNHNETTPYSNDYTTLTDVTLTAPASVTVGSTTTYFTGWLVGSGYGAKGEPRYGTTITVTADPDNPMKVVATYGTEPCKVYYNAGGFEPPTFSPGPLNNQGGWVAGFVGSGVEPAVVQSPDYVLDTQSVRLEVPDSLNDESWMNIYTADLVAAGVQKIWVTVDIFRQDTSLGNQNFYWADLGNNTYGLQWDNGNSTMPFGWSFKQGGTIRNRFARLTREQDVTAGTVSSWYDGNSIDADAYMPQFKFEGQQFDLAHQADTGSGGDIVWVDNVMIWGIGPTVTSVSGKIVDSNTSTVNCNSNLVDRTLTWKVVGTAVGGSLTLPADGSFNLPVTATGVKDICIKVSGALSVKKTNITLNGGALNLGNVSVSFPDVMNDDIWDDFDLNEINGGFGNTVTPGTGGDFNCDGVYDDFDLNQINGGFGTTGDCFGQM